MYHRREMGITGIFCLCARQSFYWCGKAHWSGLHMRQRVSLVSLPGCFQASMPMICAITLPSFTICRWGLHQFSSAAKGRCSSALQNLADLMKGAAKAIPDITWRAFDEDKTELWLRQRCITVMIPNRKVNVLLSTTLTKQFCDWSGHYCALATLVLVMWAGCDCVPIFRAGKPPKKRILIKFKSETNSWKAIVEPSRKKWNRNWPKPKWNTFLTRYLLWFYAGAPFLTDHPE